MARPLRPQFPGAVYHINARGNDRQDIYYDEKDRMRFLRKFRRQSTLATTLQVSRHGASTANYSNSITLPSGLPNQQSRHQRDFNQRQITRIVFQALKETHEKYNFLVHHVILMSNHYHPSTRFTCSPRLRSGQAGQAACPPWFPILIVEPQAVSAGVVCRLTGPSEGI